MESATSVHRGRMTGDFTSQTATLQQHLGRFHVRGHVPLPVPGLSKPDVDLAVEPPAFLIRKLMMCCSSTFRLLSRRHHESFSVRSEALPGRSVADREKATVFTLFAGVYLRQTSRCVAAEASDRPTAQDLAAHLPLRSIKTPMGSTIRYANCAALFTRILQGPR